MAKKDKPFRPKARLPKGLRDLRAEDVAARRAMLDYEWPGNIRELKHVMERTVLLAGGGSIDAPALGLAGAAGASTGGATGGEDPLAQIDELTLEEMEKRHIARVLAEKDGNRSQSAITLGISRSTLIEKIKRYGL